jgi:uncharacterized membrane protein
MADSPGDAKERVLFEGQRVTIIVNAAGALTLLVFLHAIWQQAGAVSLKRFVLYGIAAFAAGVGVALLGYVVRYWALSKNRNAGLIHQIAHIWIPVVAIACFVAGLVLPVVGGLDSLGGQQERPGQAAPKKR